MTPSHNVEHTFDRTTSPMCVFSLSYSPSRKVMTLQKHDRSVAVNNINNDLPGTTHEIVLDRKQVFKGGVAFHFEVQTVNHLLHDVICLII